MNLFRVLVGTRFNICVTAVIALEGGERLVQDERDPGGTTKFGISARAFPLVDVPTLTLEDAQKLYYGHYWVPLGCDLLPAKLAMCVFDCAVNQGQGASARLLQLAIGADSDGKVGKKTIRRVAQLDENEIISDFMARRVHRYLLSDGYSTYGRGWMRRLFLVMLSLEKLSEKH